MQSYVKRTLDRQLRDHSEGFPRVDCLALFDQQPLDHARFRRANFILHLHRFDNEQSLPGLDAFTRSHQEPNDFPRHWCDHLLAACCFERSAAVPSPLPRVANGSAKLAPGHMHTQFRSYRFDACLE